MIVGLKYQDQYFYPDPTVREAVRRMNIKEPWQYDERQFRIMRAHNVAMRAETLPKDQWTKWEDVRAPSLRLLLFMRNRSK